MREIKYIQRLRAYIDLLSSIDTLVVDDSLIALMQYATKSSYVYCSTDAYIDKVKQEYDYIKLLSKAANTAICNNIVSIISQKLDKVEPYAFSPRIAEYINDCSSNYVNADLEFVANSLTADALTTTDSNRRLDIVTTKNIMRLISYNKEDMYCDSKSYKEIGLPLLRIYTSLLISKAGINVLAATSNGKLPKRFIHRTSSISDTTLAAMPSMNIGLLEHCARSNGTMSAKGLDYIAAVAQEHPTLFF